MVITSTDSSIDNADDIGDTLKLFAVSNHTTALLGGGPLNVDYEFVEMHFHWGQTDEGSH